MSRDECKEDWSARWRLLERKHLDLQKDQCNLLGQIDDFLLGNPDPQLVHKGLTMRGDLKEDAGDLAGAKEDYLLAHNAGSSDVFARYVLESCLLASVCGRMGDAKEALEWLFRSVETCIGDQNTSCGTALHAIFTKIAYDSLSEEEMGLIKDALEHSWRVLELDGQPDLDCIGASIDRIIAAETVPHKTEQ